MNVPTVTILGGEYGTIIINESDYDENKHELYVEGDDVVVYDRKSLKEEAVELGLTHAKNITNEDLFNLIEEAKKA